VSNKFEKTVVTRGEMISEDARRLANRRMPIFEWLTLLHPVMDRIVIRASPTQTRFKRMESDPADKSMPQPLLETAGEPSEGLPLPTGVQESLHGIVGGGVEAIRVHEDGQADEIARSHHAKAVTIGSDVFFRKGLLRPQEPQGLALLAHEATHVVQALRPGASWRRATLGGVQEEEIEALGRERAVLNAPMNFRPALEGPLRLARKNDGPSVKFAPQSPVVRPMKSDANAPAPAATPKEMPAAGGLDDMRRTLFRDLLSHIRTEFERGA
jgi:hypothetical protein